MMKAVILAGGLGSRISEETEFKPKPMIMIGDKPIIWHIMKIYSHYGINDFIICCGYKGFIIKEYFSNYYLHSSDITFDLTNDEIKVHRKNAEPWTVTLIDTGQSTMTGGRLKRLLPYLKNEKYFCMTYGDGLSDVNINKLIAFHKSKNVKATITAVFPPGRFGALEINNHKVVSFQEKPRGDGSYIIGGFFVLSPEVLEFISGDDTTWEKEPLQQLALQGELAAYEHYGFWQPMDTNRDKLLIESLWNSDSPPWKVWDS